jgi:alanyl aminopeptidase
MLRSIRSVLAALMVGAAHATPALPIQLSDNVTPTAYQLALTIDPGRVNETGEVIIDVDIKTGANSLRLNASRLAIKSAQLEIAGVRLLASARSVNDDVLELLFKTPFPAGHGKLKLSFSGRLNEQDLSGLFRRRVGNDWYVYSQFEATSARATFPCFDAPRWKTPWTIALTVPAALTAVSNAPMLREVPQAHGMKRVEFAATAALPSYLIALGVGPFDVVEGDRLGKTPIRYLTPRGQADRAHYAAATTPRILGWLQDYFGRPYPYAKLDLLAVPVAGGFGAMENAGLITFGSTLMLAEPAAETDDFQRNYVATAAHELAHQWFGNDVTLAWWDDLWLNESFASWMGDKATAALMPDWHWARNLADARDNAMRVDLLASARRVHQPVHSNENISSAFDAITYAKGEVVLAMVEHWLGPTRFQAAIRSYLAGHAGSNANSDDFYAALAQQDADIAAAMRSFTEQVGIARLDVDLQCDGKPKLTLKQSRLAPAGMPAIAATPRWQIPVSIRTPAGVSRLLLKTATAEVPLPDATCPDWVEANADGVGYYVSAYSADLRRRLLATGHSASEGELRVVLDDTRMLSKSGDIGIDDALMLGERYARQDRRDIAEAALNLLLQAKPLVERDQQATYAALLQRSVGARARALGMAPKTTDDADDRLMQPQWLTTTADLGQDKVMRADAKALAGQWLIDPKAIDPALRGTILGIAALDGDRHLFDAFVKAARNSADLDERADLYTAIGNFRDPALADAARQLLLSSQHDIRDGMVILAQQAQDDAGRAAAMAFVSQRLKALLARMGRDLPAQLPAVFDAGCSEAEANQLGEVFGEPLREYAGAPTALRQSAERIRQCAAFKAMQGKRLEAYLAKH